MKSVGEAWFWRRLVRLAVALAALGMAAPADGQNRASPVQANPRTIEEVVVVGSRARIESRVEERFAYLRLAFGFDR